MNKKGLTVHVAKKTGLTLAESSSCIDAVFESIIETAMAGETTTIRGFGTFSITHRLERRGVNPHTKQPMTIQSSKKIKFTASKNVDIK